MLSTTVRYVRRPTNYTVEGPKFRDYSYRESEVNGETCIRNLRGHGGCGLELGKHHGGREFAHKDVISKRREENEASTWVI